jgi:hypothetical protein
LGFIVRHDGGGKYDGAWNRIQEEGTIMIEPQIISLRLRVKENHVIVVSFFFVTKEKKKSKRN